MKNSGFTIVEMAVLVAIIALVSATIGVSISTLSPRKLESEVQKFIGDLSWAKSMAVSTRYHYLVDFNIDGDADVDNADNMTYMIYKVDPDDLTADPGVVKRRILSVDSIVRLINGTGGDLLNFTFMSPQGNLNTTISDPVTITLERSNAAANVTIRNLTGHISWEHCHDCLP